MADEILRLTSDVSQAIRGVVDLNKALKDLSETSPNLAAALTGLTSVGGAVANEFIKGVDAAIKFEKGLAIASSAAKLSGISIDQLRKNIQELSTAQGIGFQTSDLLSAQYEILRKSAQKPQGAVKDLTDASLKLARSTGETATTAATELTEVLNAFGISAKESEQVAGVLFQTVQAGSDSISQAGQSLSRIAPAAKDLGISFNEVASTIGVLQGQGQSARNTFNALNNAISLLQQPTKQLKQFLEDLSGADAEAAVRTRGLVGVLKALKEEGNLKALTGGSEEAIRAFELLFGSLDKIEAAYGRTTDAAKLLNEQNKEVLEAPGQGFLNFLDKAKKDFLELADIALRFSQKGININENDANLKVIENLNKQKEAVRRELESRIEVDEVGRVIPRTKPVTEEDVNKEIAERNALLQEETKIKEESIKLDSKQIDALTKKFQIEKKNLEEIRKLDTQRTSDLLSKEKSISASLKSQGEARVNILRRETQLLRDIISKSETLARQSKNNINALEDEKVRSDSANAQALLGTQPNFDVRDFQDARIRTLKQESEELLGKFRAQRGQGIIDDDSADRARDRLKEISTLLQEQFDQSVSLNNEGKQPLVDLEEQRRRIQENFALRQDLERELRTTANARVKSETDALEKQDVKIKEAADAVREASNLKVQDFKGNLLFKNVEELSKAFDEITAKAGNDPVLQALLGQQKQAKVNEFQLIKDQSTQDKNLNDFLQKANSVEETLKKSATDASILQQAIANIAVPNLVLEQFKLVEQALSSVKVKAQETAQEVQKLQILGVSGGPVISGRAFGGVGPDSSFARVAPNEMVMNGGATSKFYSTLQKMNASGGSGSTTNNTSTMGDVNITVEGNRQDLGNVILDVIKQAKRRGNF